MRVVLQVVLCAGLLVWSAPAQRGGGHGGGGGFHGGGGGIGHGSVGGGFGGGGFRGTTGGFGGGRSTVGNYGGFRGGAGYGYGGLGYRGYGYGGYGRGFYGGYWPYSYWGLGWGYPWGYGFGYWPDYYDYGYPSGYGYDPNAYGYNDPNVTVVYPPSQPAPAPVYTTETARPVLHSYDQYGQEIQPAGGSTSSPIYLIALNSGVIQAAASYWVDGKTLHYVTLQHEEKQAALSSVDRTLTNQLNRERHVTLNLPAQ